MDDPFADLIPDTGPASPAPPPPSADPFADLIPKARAAQAAPAVSEAPAPSASADPFADLTPRTAPVGAAQTPHAEGETGVLGTFGAEAAKAAISLPAEALKGAGVAAGQFSDQPIEQSSLYQTGKNLQKYADTWGATEESLKEHPIAGGAGAVVGGVAGALPLLGAAAAAAPALGVGAGTAALGAGAATFAASAAGNTFNAALLKGADETTASKAAGLSAIVGGGLGVLPLGVILAPVRAYTPGLTGWAATALEKALRSGIVFTGVGEAQEFLGRQIAKEFYDPNAGYSADVNRLFGSFLGGGIVGVVTPQMLHGERTKPLTDQTVREQQQDVKPKTTPAIAAAEAEALRTSGGAPPLVSEPMTEATGIANELRPTRGWTAYHGSGAEFTQLDPTKVLTGEGNASFGRGDAYVAENQATGKDYQNRMGGYFYGNEPYDATNPAHKAAMQLEIDGSREQAIRSLEEKVAADTTRGPSAARQINANAAEVLRSETPLAPLEHRGYFYTMLVKRPKEEFLDWDKPLSEQPSNVQLGVGKALQEAGVDTSGMFQARGMELYSSLARALEKTGGDGQLQASELLYKHGIAGNRYLDSGSRSVELNAQRWDRAAQDAQGKINDIREELKANEKNPSIVQGFFENRFRDIRQLEGEIANATQQAAATRAGAGQTYNAVVFKAHDIDVTHRNGIPLKPEEKKAIQSVQFGTPVEDNHGRAIVNGYALDNISADEMKTFSQGAPTTETSGVGRNGYDVNSGAMNKAGVKDFPNTPITEQSAVLRNTIKGLWPNGKVPPGLEAAATGVDHFSERFKALNDLRAITDGNPWLEPLVRYTMTQDHMHTYASQWQVRAEDTWRVASKLWEGQKRAFSKFVDDYINMRFLTPQEYKAGVVRQPTAAEFAAMEKLHGVDKQTRAVFDRMQRDFKDFVGEMFGIQKLKAQDLPGPEQARVMNRIGAQEKAMGDRPYFPATRYGLYTIATRGPDGPRYYRFETEREQRAALRKLEKNKKPGEEFTPGKLPQSALPFSGLPKQMLEVIEQQFLPHSKDAAELRGALKQMEFEMNPIRGFGTKLGRGAPIPGYSTDFLRNFSNFFFHGSSYLSRMKHVDELKAAMSDLRESAIGAKDPVKRAQIADFIENHYQKMMDPRGDWAKTRAFMFHMALGFRPASAAANLTQTLLSTYPHLAAAFGDVGTVRSMTKAASTWHNFWRRSSTEGSTDPEIRAMHELMQAGRIRGAQAPELAMTSEGRGLLGGYGFPRAQSGLTQFLKMSAGLFEMTEQWNRRVAGMATYDLAMRNPQSKVVQKAIVDDPQFFAELRAKGFPTNEAAAITTAKMMIDRTQFQYSKEYRPAYMSGPIGSTIFIFKNFTHRMVWNMYNYPSAGMRQLLIMGFLGGLMGVPGFADLNGVLKAAALNFFGKDFDLEDEARRFAVEHLGMKGKGQGVLDDPFTIVKGFASRGYGIPAIADFLGEWAGVGKIPIPELDRSAAISLGNLLPIDFGTAFGPKFRKDPGTAFAEGVSRGMGAFGSYAYNTYKALANIRDDVDSLKRWERVAPTFLANMSHAARVYAKGGEFSNTGSKIVTFDPHDTEHMMEMLAMAAGYTPFRLSKEWTRIRAEAESKVMWDVRREILLNQFYSTYLSKDKDDKERVLQSIRNFNQEVKGTPARGQTITSDTIRQSVDRRDSARLKQNAGIPASEKDIPLVRSIRELFPGSEIETRRVR